jgi:putative radical SAM enzyme (TIGR03279 family)
LGKKQIISFEKLPDEDAGLILSPPSYRRCQNRCLFCFIDQLPPGMRSTLYFKDEDFRLSFVFGNYLTLTSLTREDQERIIAQRLSPLYISVHATNPALRQKMLRHPRAGKIGQQIRQLAEGGIEMHTQIVLCPGINDGLYLEQTIRDLSSFWPEVKSIAIVPVGLTRYRQHLFPLSPVTENYAREIIEWVAPWQKEFRSRLRETLVYLSDEFYLLTGHPFPSVKDYGEFPQYENGIGMVVRFREAFQKEKNYLPGRLTHPRKVTVVTGFLAYQILSPLIVQLNRISRLQINLVAVKNDFFGYQVSVAGLLTGQDIQRQLTSQGLGEEVLLPQILISEDELGRKVFLDDITVEELSHHLGVKVKVVSATARGLLEGILGNDYHGPKVSGDNNANGL